MGLTDPLGEAVHAVCLHTVLPQAQKDTSRATAASRLRSITSMHDGTSPLKCAQQQKARMLSCASRASPIWLTALPIHNALTFSKGAFRNLLQFQLGLSPRPMHAPRVRCGCRALAMVDPLQAHPTSFSTLKSAPRSPPHGLRATIFSVGLDARSCNPLGCPPPLSPTARELPDPTQSPRLVTGRISCEPCWIVFCSPMSL